MTDEFAADKARRIALEVIRACGEVVALVESRPIDLAMMVQVEVITAQHQSNVWAIQQEAPPPKPGDRVREVRRLDLRSVLAPKPPEPA